MVESEMLEEEDTISLFRKCIVGFTGSAMSKGDENPDDIAAVNSANKV